MNDDGCGAVVAVGIAALTVGCVLGNGCCNTWWRSELIKRDYAEYNSRNGAWQWKEPLHGLQPRTSEAAGQTHGGCGGA